MSKLRKQAERKFAVLSTLNSMIAKGGEAAVIARKGKAAMIDRDTDGRSRFDKEPRLAGSELWNPDAKRFARGRDDTTWINRKNKGKAGAFAGKSL